MKNLTKNKISSVTPLVDKLKKKIESSHKAINSTDAPYIGKQMGSKQLPSDDEDCEIYYAKLISMYSQLFYSVSTELNGTTQLALGAMAYNNHQTQIKEKEEELKGVHTRLNNATHDLESMNDTTFNKTYMWVVAFLIVVDIINYWQSFTVYYRDNAITALVMAIGSAIGIVGIIHVGVVGFRDTSDKSVKTIFKWLFIPLAVISACLVGELRYLQILAGHGEPSLLSQIILIGFNLMILAFNAGLVFIYAPSHEQSIRRKQKVQLQKTIKVCNKKRNKLIDTIQTLKSQQITDGEVAIVKRQAQLDFHETIQHMYQESVATLKYANMRERTTPVPTGFKKKPEPLDLKIDDINFQTQ